MAETGITRALYLHETKRTAFAEERLVRREAGGGVEIVKVRQLVDAGRPPIVGDRAAEAGPARALVSPTTL